MAKSPNKKDQSGSAQAGGTSSQVGSAIESVDQDISRSTVARVSFKDLFGVTRDDHLRIQPENAPWRNRMAKEHRAVLQSAGNLSGISGLPLDQAIKAQTGHPFPVVAPVDRFDMELESAVFRGA